MSVKILLSMLVASNRNPRRVKPERDAHRRLVASIKAYGLLEPLVVRKRNDGKYAIIAGDRRLAALRSVHRDANTEIDCVLREVDSETAAAMSLAENFAREPMHPLDEAEAFAKLASSECRGVSEIATHFGVTENYVRQRMKLATLADPIKAAYRGGTIDTGVAEVFSAVPESRQLEVWQEVGGCPQHASHVRNIIRNQWVDGRLALFDLSSLPPESVSADLFAERVIVERAAFMEAQGLALQARKTELEEDGWKEVVVAELRSVQDRLYTMDRARPAYTEEVEQRLGEIADKRGELEAELSETDADGGTVLTDSLDALDEEEDACIAAASPNFEEAVKAAGTVFLLIDAEGRVTTEYRLPRQRASYAPNGGGVFEPKRPPSPPTSADLSDYQQAVINAYEGVLVRDAVSKGGIVAKRLIALALHSGVAHDGLSVSHELNATEECMGRSGGPSSAEHAKLTEVRKEVDPLYGMGHVDDDDAYRMLCGLSEAELDRLTGVLIACCLTGHAQRTTPLISVLREELGVSLRAAWRPDAEWLASYQKCQLAHLVETLKGRAYGPSALKRKKSEVVDELDQLFANAAMGDVGEPDLAVRVNAWLPNSVEKTDQAVSSEVAA